MPIIAQIMIPVKFDNGTVEILRERFNESSCGCLNLVTESNRLNIPVGELRQSVYALDGITCKGDDCCVSDIQSFAEKLKKFRGD